MCSQSPLTHNKEQMSSDGEKLADYKVLVNFVNGSPDVVFGARDLQSALKLFAAAYRMEHIKAVSMVALIRPDQSQPQPHAQPQPQAQAAAVHRTPVQEDPQVAAAVNAIDGMLPKRTLAEPEPAIVRPFVPTGGEQEDLFARDIRPPRRLVDSKGRPREGSPVDRDRRQAPAPVVPTKKAPTKADIDQLLQLRGELESVERGSSSHMREHLAAYIQGVTRNMMDTLDWSEHRSFWPDLEMLHGRCRAIEADSHAKRTRTE